MPLSVAESATAAASVIGFRIIQICGKHAQEQESQCSRDSAEEGQGEEGSFR